MAPSVAQPADSPPLGIAHRQSHAVQDFKGAVIANGQPVANVHCHLGQQLAAGAHQPVEAIATGQPRKQGAQLAVRRAIKGAFRGKARCLSRQTQGDDLAGRQPAGGPGCVRGGRVLQKSSTSTYNSVRTVSGSNMGGTPVTRRGTNIPPLGDRHLSVRLAI